MELVKTRRVIELIKSGSSSELSAISPFAAALMPLVVTLDSYTSLRDVAEAMPHLEFEFDKSAFFSILSRLGFKCDSKKVVEGGINANITPCVFESSDNKTFVIYKVEGGKCIYYDADEDRTKFGELSHAGVAHSFSKVKQDVAQQLDGESWFWNLTKRFRPLARQLFGISFITNLTTLAVPLFVMTVYDSVIAKKHIELLPMLVIGISLALAVDIFLRFVRSRLLALPAGRLEYLLSTESLKQLFSLPAVMTERSPVTFQLARLRLYDSIREFFTGATALVVLELPFIPVYMFALYLLGGDVVYVPVLLVIALLLVGSVIMPKMKLRMDQAARAKNSRDQLLLETLNAVVEVKSLGEEDGWMQRVRESSAKTIDAGLQATQMQMLASNISQSLNMLAAILVLSIGTQKVISADISIGALIAIMAILWRITGPFQSVFLAYVQFDQIRRGIRGLDDLMMLKKERVSDVSALYNQEHDGAINFERVSFRYGPGLDPVLNGVSFSIEEKEMAVFIGDNGSGKSTILKLLSGMYYAQSGNIYIDGSDIRQLNVNELRRMIGYVPQQPRLFTGTIRTNLLLSDILATEEQLEEATKLAGIYQDICKLEHGFETKIGDFGSIELPASLRRGICIARAFLRDSPILIFDEPGASQDKVSLKNFMKQLEQIKGKKTILIVTHLPQLIKMADKLVELERGSTRRVIQNSAPKTVMQA